jgi:hypothetical protein
MSGRWRKFLERYRIAIQLWWLTLRVEHLRKTILKPLNKKLKTDAPWK